MVIDTILSKASSEVGAQKLYDSIYVFMQVRDRIEPSEWLELITSLTTSETEFLEAVANLAGKQP